MFSYFALVFLATICVTNGFQAVPRRAVTHGLKRMNLKASTEIFEGIRGPVESYVNIWVPLFKDIQPSVPEALIHWGHGGAMATVLFAMGGIGTFLGWQMRLGNGSNVYSFTMGKTAREMHPIIMGLASFFFLLGGQGGLVLLATQGKDILHSDHALTAIIGLGLLAVQIGLSTQFPKNPSLRSVHAYLGTATMAVLVLHAYNGLNLGLSF